MEPLEERLRALFMDAPLAIAVQRGPEHVYELANEVYRRFLGGGDLTGKKRRDVLPDHASLAGILDRVYATGESFVAKEFPFYVDRRGDGSWEKAWFNVSVEPTRDAGGAVGGVVTFGVEVTEYVQARRQIEALASELKQAVKARDEFLAIASHELRTPLTPLLLQSQLLRKTIEGGTRDKLRERADLIQRSVERLSELTHTMLDVSRLTAQRLDLTPAEIDLHELAGQVIERLRPSLERSGSTLALEASAPVVGQWDRLRLDQIVTNLVSNAIKYGDGKPISVGVEARGGAAVVRVADQGIGIAPADQVRIFERFERAVPTRHYGGFGLGLWIARQLVEAIGGTIRVESALGQGATFTVTLPL